MSTLSDVRNVLTRCLRLGDEAASFTEETTLLGSLPELDSMAVVTLVTALEDEYGFAVEDDEIGAETFETLGSLTNFVDRKLAT